MAPRINDEIRKALEQQPVKPLEVEDEQSHAKYVLIPASEDTHGHFTHLRAKFWKGYVADFLKELPGQM